MNNIGAKFLGRLYWLSSFGSATLITVSVYLIFLLFLFVQHGMVFPYYDDWGYAVLDYRSVQNGFSGQEFQLSHVCNFLIDMYKDWSGRVFSIFLEIYLLKFGLWYVRIFQVTAILLALIFSVKIAADRDRLNKISLLIWVVPIILFLALPPDILIGGIYWFAASSSYLWGSAALLLGVYVIAAKKKITVGSSFLLSLAAVFNEQIGCATIAFLIAYIAYDYIFQQQKQRTIEKIYFLIPVVLLAAATIFAPGNFHRKSLSNYISDSIVEIIFSNFTNFSRMLFAQHSIYLWLLTVSFLVLLFSSVKKPILSARNVFNLSYPIAVLLIAYFFLPLVFFSICFMALYSYVLFKSCRANNEGIIVISIFCASLGSLVPLLLAPETPARATIPFFMLCFAPIIFSFAVVEGSTAKKLLTATLSVLLVFSISNTETVFNVYRENYEASTINHYQLTAASYMFKNNIEIGDTVILFKPSPNYAAVMPFQKPMIERWMKKYYEIPQEVIFDWRSKSTYTASNTTNKEWVNGIARDWAVGFFITYTPESAIDFAVGKQILLADGSQRTVLRNQVNGNNLIVYLDGIPLDGKLVGYPKPIIPQSNLGHRYIGK